MKTFTKTLAALVAVSLAALALSSCKKIQPTELTEASTNATVIKGSVVYLKTTAQGENATDYTTIADDAFVTITTQIKTGNFTENAKGEKVEETVASVQKVAIVDKVFQANLPVAAGEKYDVEVRCEFETSGFQKIGTAVASGICKYKGVQNVKVAYGQVFVCNVTAALDGFEATSTKGKGSNSASAE